MESTFDFDKVYNDIVCDKECENARLKKVVENLEKYISKQQKLKDAKDEFISTVCNIVHGNNSYPRVKEYDVLSFMGAFKKVQPFTNFIDSLNSPCMIEYAMLLKCEITNLALPEIERRNVKKDYCNIASFIQGIHLGMKSFYTSNFHLQDLFDCSGSPDQFAIKYGNHVYDCLNQIMHAVVKYLDVMIEQW